jgi:glucosyl-3-phosphoglycerate phosphatase
MTDTPTTVYLVRHGQTALNESGVLRGLLDPPLDDTGLRQAARLGQVLGLRQPSLVAASPLCRARQTAQPTADHAGLNVTTDECFLDRDYGPWAGKPKGEVTAQWGSVDAAPGVEPRSAVRDRAVQGLTALAQRFPGASVVVVSHDAVNQEVLAAMHPGLGDPEDIQQDNGCFNVLQLTGDGMTVLSINELPAGT